MRRRIRGPERLAAAAVALLALLASGCAKKGLPSGGPPDLVPPRILSVSPDSGAVGVARTPTFTVAFSEAMEPRTSSEAVSFIPPLEIRSRRWSRSRELSIELRDSLAADQVYRLVVDGSARDARGNTLEGGRSSVFTTAAAFPPGRIDGRIEAVGFQPGGTSLWAYREGHHPDSTARDFDALGIADADGLFRIAGLAVPERWTLWAFADLNGNRSFEPDADLLVRADSAFELGPRDSARTGFLFRIVNPRAPGVLKGVIVDTLGIRDGALRLYALSETDSTRRLLLEVPDAGTFEMQLEPGPWRVRAFRDLDRNRIWKRDHEAASEELRFTVTPGGRYAELKFVLLRPLPVGDSP